RYVAITGIGDHRAVTDERGRAFSINERRVTGVKGMPDPQPGAIYVVPVEIAMALQEERPDVVYLAEDAEIRGEAGKMQRVSHLRRTVLRNRHPETLVQAPGPAK